MLEHFYTICSLWKMISNDNRIEVEMKKEMMIRGKMLIHKNPCLERVNNERFVAIVL